MSGRSFDASEKAAKVVAQLNSTWGLQLPRLHGEEARKVQNHSEITAKRCSSRIQYLCNFSEDIVDKIVAEFEDEAKYIFSNWVWKPSQEKGTLPLLSSANSTLRQDIFNSQTRYISPELQTSLVRKLASILDDEYILAQDSRSYQRTSSQSISNSSSRNASYATAATEPSSASSLRKNFLSQSQEISRSLSPNKRRNTSGQLKDKRPKLQSASTESLETNQLINSYFRKLKKSSSHTALEVHCRSPTSEQSQKLVGEDDTEAKPVCDIATSFDSALSAVQSIFSPVCSPTSAHSANTSFLFDAEESQNYFPTQEANDCLADESFASALDLADNARPAQLFSFDDLNSASPFRRLQPLPAELHFWVRWEIYRVAQSTDLLPMSLYNAAQKHLEGDSLRYGPIWNALGACCKDNGKFLPDKSDIQPWMEESGEYESPDGKTVYFTFSLEYNQMPGPSLWKLNLNPIKIDKGNRFHRHFGADRHITGFVNYFDKSSLPKWITQRASFNAENALQRIGSWLAMETHHIAGRSWRAFFLEAEKTNSKRNNGEAPRQKISLFAVDGVDFPQTASQSSKSRGAKSIADFIDWHIPLCDNLGSTDLKLFSRFGLGLSKTIATVTLRPDQFRHLVDTEPIMNDGCALMSMSMAAAIWSICGDGTSEIPSAFQGRIGGAKGLWVVDYRAGLLLVEPDQLWIQVSDSQLKIKPHPKDRHIADRTQRTFEVLKWSSPCAPGHLNMQLINILADRGVSRSTLRQIVLNDIEEYIEASRAAMKHPQQLQAWLHDYHRTDRHEHPVSFDDGLPEMREEEARFLVESGFSAEDCEYLRRSIILLMTQRLNTYVDKLRIQVPHSTTTFCVPDPYHVLEEDEVYLGFSNPWENPRTGLKETTLHDLDILVARNPAALASDIQKRRAVFKQELRHFKDVIVFPTKGKIPLASLLSGGDYDGDTVAIFWDPELVDNFHNVEKPELPTEEQCGLQKVSRQLSDIVKCSPPSESDIEKFLTSCIVFNAQPSRLGICTNEHEKLIYSGAKLADTGSVLLAALAGYLVDANKQGLSQSERDWFKLRKTAQSDRKLVSPAYKNGQDMPRRWSNGECVNIIDHLKFDVAMKRKEDILVEFEKMLPNTKAYDRVLSMPFLEQYSRSMNNNDPAQTHVTKILEDLKKRLDLVIDEWQRRYGRRLRDEKKNNFATDVRHISRMIRDIDPLACDCDIYQDFLREREAVIANNPLLKGTRWSLLRASAMYKWYNKNKVTFPVVGDELCRIKARSMGPTRELASDRHHFLKTDTKLIKRWAKQGMEGDDDDYDDEMND